MKKNLSEIVMVVNEVHHDYEEDYNVSNTLMHNLEKKNWGNFLKRNSLKDKKILEIGTGEGFLPLLFLKKKVTFKKFTCTDISGEILARAKKNIKNKDYDLKNVSFKKLDSQKLPFKEGEYDCIVLNSVLHHLPDIKLFYEESSRVLKKGGILVIGHEPNMLFRKNFFLFSVYRIGTFVFSSLGKILSIFRRNSNKKKWQDIANKKLIEKNLIINPLPYKEISSLVDFHYGINPLIFHKKDFKLESLKTENFLFTLNFAYNFWLWNILVNIYEFIFSYLFPNSGGTYFSVYKKLK